MSQPRSRDHSLLIVYTTLGALALGAFSLSFSKLCAFAVSGGITPALSPVFALVVDGTIVAAICGQVHATRNELTRLGNRFRLVNIGGALFSVTANVWEFHGTFQEAACAAFGPVSLWVVSELIMLTALAYDAVRDSETWTPAPALNAAKRASKPQPLSPPDPVTSGGDPSVTPDDRRAVVTAMHAAGDTIANIARHLGCSRQTVYRDIESLGLKGDATC